MGSLSSQIISKSSDKYKHISFKELEDDCFLSSLMNIKIYHSHHYIKFDFTISGEDPFLINDSFIKSYKYTHQIKANKFHFAKSYNLSSPKVFDTIPFFLYNSKGQNFLIEGKKDLDSNTFAEIEFLIADGIDRENILTSIVPSNDKYTSSLEDVVKRILDTSIWEFIKE